MLQMTTLLVYSHVDQAALCPQVCRRARRRRSASCWTSPWWSRCTPSSPPSSYSWACCCAAVGCPASLSTASLSKKRDRDQSYLILMFKFSFWWAEFCKDTCLAGFFSSALSPPGSAVVVSAFLFTPCFFLIGGWRKKNFTWSCGLKGLWSALRLDIRY